MSPSLPCHFALCGPSPLRFLPFVVLATCGSFSLWFFSFVSLVLCASFHSWFLLFVFPTLCLRLLCLWHTGPGPSIPFLLPPSSFKAYTTGTQSFALQLIRRLELRCHYHFCLSLSLVLVLSLSLRDYPRRVASGVDLSIGHGGSLSQTRINPEIRVLPLISIAEPGIEKRVSKLHCASNGFIWLNLRFSILT